MLAVFGQPSLSDPFRRRLIEPCSLSHDLRRVFSKDSALSLPPHCPYDCAIELLPGVSLPSKKTVWHLPSREAGNREVIVGASVCSDSSVLLTGWCRFLFVEKKDKTLRPRIDYKGLNNITVINKYQLPCIHSTFSPLHDATILTKLDLRNAYQLVCIREGDKWKMCFLTRILDAYLVLPFHSEL